MPTVTNTEKRLCVLVTLLHLDDTAVQARLKTILESKNLELAGCYHQEPMSYPALLDWCGEQAEKFSKYICDTGTFIDKALSCGKKLFLRHSWVH